MIDPPAPLLTPPAKSSYAQVLERAAEELLSVEVANSKFLTAAEMMELRSDAAALRELALLVEKANAAVIRYADDTEVVDWHVASEVLTALQAGFSIAPNPQAPGAKNRENND